MPLKLIVGVHLPLKAAFRTDIQATIRHYRHNLPRRPRCKFRLVAGELDPLAFIFASTVSHMPAAALATVHAITVTRKLTALALHRGEPQGAQWGQLTGPGTVGDALIEDLQGLLAVVRRLQSPPSSPQKA
jgi:hypothetical protein